MPGRGDLAGLTISGGRMINLAPGPGGSPSYDLSDLQDRAPNYAELAAALQSARAEIARLQERERMLLDANNAELERRRRSQGIIRVRAAVAFQIDDPDPEWYVLGKSWEHTSPSDLSRSLAGAYRVRWITAEINVEEPDITARVEG